jgi:phosphonate transport system substrate-binding protein
MSVLLTFGMPPSLGRAKATARAELLATRLSHELGQEVRVVVVEDYAALGRMARERSVDIAWMPAAVCAKSLDALHAVLTVRRLGQVDYRSAIVGRRSARLSLRKLDGLRAAWVDPSSLGGGLLAREFLLSRGISPDHVLATQTYVGSHPEALAAVLHGSADITAITIVGDDLTHAANHALTMHAGPLGADLEVLATTRSVPNDAVVLTRALPRVEAERLASTWLDSPEVRPSSFLLSVLDADGFERAEPAVYARLLPLLR